MERAIKQLGQDYLAHTEHLHKDWTLVQEYPLSRDLLAISHVWKSPDGIDFIIAAKGAPEAILDLCHLDQDLKQSISEQIIAMADKGLRVLGVARASFRETDLPIGQHDFGFNFLGLVRHNTSFE